MVFGWHSDATSGMIANNRHPKEDVKNASKRVRSKAQAEKQRRARPGTTGQGDFYHIEVRPKSEFQVFRTHDVGEPGGIERVSGKRSSGSWDTQKWLIGKRLAHVVKGRLVANSQAAEKVLNTLGSEPRLNRGDYFSAKPRPNIPDADKPTRLQQRARRRNIQKAQAVRHEK